MMNKKCNIYQFVIDLFVYTLLNRCAGELRGEVRLLLWIYNWWPTPINKGGMRGEGGK